MNEEQTEEGNASCGYQIADGPDEKNIQNIFETRIKTGRFHVL